jgi:hypothetical protein
MTAKWFVLSRHPFVLNRHPFVLSLSKHRVIRQRTLSASKPKRA